MKLRATVWHCVSCDHAFATKRYIEVGSDQPFSPCCGEAGARAVEQTQTLLDALVKAKTLRQDGELRALMRAALDVAA